MTWLTRPSAFAVASPIRTGLQTPRPTRPSNKKYQVLSFLCILSAHIKSSEQNYFALLYFVCREITRRKVALYRGDGDMPNVIWHMWLSLLNGFPHRLTMPRPTLPPAPVYSAAVDSPVINFMADYFRPRHIRCYFSYAFS